MVGTRTTTKRITPLRFRKEGPSQRPQLPDSAPLLKVNAHKTEIQRDIFAWDGLHGLWPIQSRSLSSPPPTQPHWTPTVSQCLAPGQHCHLISCVFFIYPLGCIWFSSQINPCCESLAPPSGIHAIKQTISAFQWVLPAFACSSVFRQAASANAKRKFCLEYSQSYQHKTGYPSFSSIPQFKTKTTKKEKKNAKTLSVHKLTKFFYLSETLSSLLSLDNKLSHLSPASPPCSLSVFMAASHTISCSPALFADGRDERDGAGWLLGYWALSTNGRPWQGRFHAPPPRRQPSEQHSHFSTLSLSMFFPLCVCSSSPFVGKDQIHKGLTLCSKACRCGYRNPCWSMFRKRFLENQNNNWQMPNMAALVVGSSLHWADQSTKSNQ